MRRWWRAAAVGSTLAMAVALVAALVAASGPAASTPPDHPIGVRVARIAQACQALTPDEVGDIAKVDGVRLHEDLALRSPYSVGHECVYENDPKRNLQPDAGYFIVVLTVERDPDAKLYADYRSSAKDAKPIRVGDDEGFTGGNRVGARHGIWCVLATMGVEGKDGAYQEIMRRFVSRLPRTNQVAKS
jgi:hypothetical protein